MKSHRIPMVLLAFALATFVLCGNVVGEVGTLSLNRGRWLFVTKAVDGPSDYDLDFLASVVASTALTEGQPSVLAVNNTNSLAYDSWHKDYTRRYKYSRAIVVGQTITTIPGVFPVTNLNSTAAGVEQAKEIARTVWQSSKQVVVCSANDYTNSLVAASLAARLRVPLLFSAASGDLDVVMGQLNVQSALVVGSAVTLPVSSQNLAGSAAVINWLIANGFPVNYVAAVNPNDRSSSSGGIKLSLASVVLAARRGGVIYPITNATTYVTAGDELKQLYASVGPKYYPEYLLLGGAPTHIPFGQVTGLAGPNTEWNPLMTDTLYANVDADTFMEIAVGRLVANNFSEATLIASRISTYEALKDGNWEKRFADMGKWGIWVAVAVLQKSGFVCDDLKSTTHNNSPPIEDGIILHQDHSAWWELGGAFSSYVGVKTLLAPALVISSGCSTAELDQPGVQISKDLLRQGAVGFMGGTRQVTGIAEDLSSELVNSITQFESIGHAWRRGFQALSLYLLDTGNIDDDIARYNWILIGDPALVLHVPTQPATRPAGSVVSADGKTLTVSAPDTWSFHPYPYAQLAEWGPWDSSASVHVASGSGVSLFSMEGPPGYHFMVPHYLAKYRTAGRITNVTQQPGIPSPLGWGGSFANNVHVDEHSDGTRTYFWKLRLLDYEAKYGGIINQTVTDVAYSISLSDTNLGSRNLAPVWNANPVIKLNGQYQFPFNGSLGADVRDPEGNPLKFLKTGGATWLSVDLNGGLRGQPDAEGVSSATVTVSDGVNPPVPVTLQISVAPSPPQDTTPPSPDPMSWQFAPTLGDNGSVLGSYVMVGASNDWHWVTIIKGTNTELAWSNRAGYVWNLIPDYANKKLLTDSTCPYPGESYSITVSNGEVTGFTSGGSVFTRIAPNSVRASMTALQAVDQTGVEYFFEETSGNPGGKDSGWIESSTYVNDGLKPGCTYSYTVKARDRSPAQNMTTTSSVMSVTCPGGYAVVITPSGGTADVAEGGATDTYTVNLFTQPTANVTVNITPDSQVYVSPTSLTFTPANWNTGQTVTVTAVNDSINEFAHTGTINHSTTSADANYNAIPIDGLVVNITDNDNIAPASNAGPDQTVYLIGDVWSPANLNPIAWYDATDAATITAAGGRVSQWSSKTGTSHMLQATAGKQPATGNVANRINGLNTIGFDGADDALQTASNPFGASISNAMLMGVFNIGTISQSTLFSLTGSSNPNNRWQSHAPWADGTLYYDCGGSDTPNRISKASGWAAGENKLLGYYSSTTDNVQQVWVDATNFLSDTTGHTAPVASGMALGYDGDTTYDNCAMGEVFILNGTVSASNRQKLEGHLAHKWGLQGSLPASHPYKTQAPNNASAVANLHGTVSDANGDSLTTTWSVVSGPAPVSIGNANALDTTATFTMQGVYTLRLSASDPGVTTSDDVVITVGIAAGSVVTYNGNGHTNGTVPNNQVKSTGVNLTLATNSGNLARTGFTYAGWNTAANGAGSNYAAGATYSTNANLALFAKWTPKNYTVTFDANGGTTPSPSSKSVTFTSTYGTLATTSRTGYTFNGWFTAASGGTEVTDVTNVTTADNHTLFAHWTGNPYTVSYDGNGSTSGSVPSNQTKIHDDNLVLSDAGTLIKTGFTFAGWNTVADGSGATYAAGATYSGNASLILYAQWAPGTNGTWLPTSAGPFNWSDPVNWTSGLAATGADRTAFFTPNITANQVVNLDSAMTIGNITFTDSTSSSHNLTISGANILTLDVGSNKPVIHVTQSSRQLEINSVIAGSDGLEVTGPGTLKLTAANTYTGGTVLNGGAMIISADTNLGNASGGITFNGSATLQVTTFASARSITLNNNAIANIYTTAAATWTVNGAVTGNGGITLSGLGGQNVMLNSDSNNFTGPIWIGQTTNKNFNGAILTVKSLADSASPITFGYGNSGPGGHSQAFVWNGSSDLVLNNRYFQFGPVANTGIYGSGQIENANAGSANTLTINTDLVVSTVGGSIKYLTLRGVNTGANTFAGKIGNGSGMSIGLLKAGTGTWVLSGANTYSGATTVSAGTLAFSGNANVASPNPLGQSPAAAANLLLGNGAKLKYTGAAASTDRSFTINGTAATHSATLDASGTGAINFTSTASLAYGTTNQTRTLNLIGTHTGDNTLAATIGNNGASTNTVSLTKNGDGKWVLTGANSYTGTTTVTLGTLLINGDQSLATGAVAINGGTLGGAGTLGGTVTVGTNGNIAPGASAGTLRILGGLNVVAMATGTTGKLQFELGANTASSDQIAVTGALSIGTGQLGFSDFVFSNLGWQNGTYTLITSGSITGSLPSSGLSGTIGSGGTGTIRLNGTNVELVVSGLTSSPGPLDHFAISAIGSPQAVGTPITGITLTAQDASNVTVTSFTGTVNFGGSGGFTGTSASFTAGVLNSVSVTPTAAGNALTFTVSDGTHFGSTSIATIRTQYVAWSDGVAFDADTNNDGVSNGLAWLLGATNPSAAVTLPTVTLSSGNLVLSFTCLNDAHRGTASLNVEHSSDLGTSDPWASAAVSDTPTSPFNGVTFSVTPGSPCNTVQATISSSEATSGKLFSRFKAVKMP